jgi:hypothetical protein
MDWEPAPSSFSTGPAEVPCPDCAKSKYPGEYIGFFEHTREKCRTCGGSAKVGKPVEARPPDFAKPCQFGPGDYLGSSADQAVYFRTSLFVFPSKGIWYWSAGITWESRKEGCWCASSIFIFAKSADKPPGPPPPIEQIPILDGIPE